MTDGRTAAPRRAAAWVLLAAALAAAGCGGRRLAAGTAPFPSEKPVFVDSAGRPLRDLPPTPEPLKLVVLDFPWCPPCGEVWEAVRTACGTLAPGTVRVYRILFDRERYFTRDGVSAVHPLRPAPPASPPGTAPPALAFTTLTALPDAFREEYEIAQAPVVLLLSARGKVLARWTGYSASLSASLAGELGRTRAPDQDSSVSPPP